jgi:hypothetical protein
MKRLVEFTSENGEPIVVEGDDVGLAGETWRTPRSRMHRTEPYGEAAWVR